MSREEHGEYRERTVLPGKQHFQNKKNGVSFEVRNTPVR